MQINFLKWQVSAEKLERDAYKAAFTQQKPFFIFDAQPLVIVYTTTPAGIKAMYFIDRAGELQWTNASHLTRVDQIFKRGIMIQAAAAEPPFATLVIASQRTASNWNADIAGNWTDGSTGNYQCAVDEPCTLEEGLRRPAKSGF